MSAQETSKFERHTCGSYFVSSQPKTDQRKFRQLRELQRQILVRIDFYFGFLLFGDFLFFFFVLFFFILLFFAGWCSISGSFFCLGLIAILFFSILLLFRRWTLWRALEWVVL